MKHLRLFLRPALIAITAALSSPAYAGGAPSQVVELFTSQGCSSCPPTNALLNDWAGRDDILALTYSVEYWDYLGWKDTFANPKFAARQRAYAKALGHGRVYTPQMVINGQIDKFKFSRAQIDDVLLPDSAPAMIFTGDNVTIKAVNDDISSGVVRLVTYAPGVQTVDVKRGENSGRSLTLTNVVTDVSDLGVWNTQDSTFALPEAVAGKAYAVLLQEDEFGPVMSAAIRD